MMKFSIIPAFLFFTIPATFLSAGKGAPGPTIDETMDLAEARLKNYEEIGEWKLSRDEANLYLTSKFDLSISATEAIATPLDEEAKEPGTKSEPFQIRINFIPFESFDAFKKQRTERLDLAAKLNKEVLDENSERLPDEVFFQIWDELSKKKLPSHYSGNFNVTIYSPLDNPNLSFEPSDKLQSCVWMLYRVGFLFTEWAK